MITFVSTICSQPTYFQVFSPYSFNGYVTLFSLTTLFALYVHQLLLIDLLGYILHTQTKNREQLWVLKKAGDTQLSKLGISLQLFPFPIDFPTVNGGAFNGSKVNADGCVELNPRASYTSIS